MLSLSNKSVVDYVINETLQNNSILMTVSHEDGSSGYIPVTLEQAISLGLKVVPAKVDKMVAENLDKSNDDGNVEVVETNKSVSNIIYRVVKPEDLNLKPIVQKYLPRGRPKKKAAAKTEEGKGNAKKVTRQATTRSGRVTKPPRHIEASFKKIDVTEPLTQEDVQIKTVEFEPLTTNAVPVETEPLVSLEQHRRKRVIPSRFRCPTCNKAYLGKAKMLSHFDKNPDHGSVPDRYRSKNTATWDFLRLTVQKHRGSKGEKFCEELLMLLQNVRNLAKFLFKPALNEENRYYVTSELAYFLDIKEGDYSIDETELFRDFTFYEYLESNSDNVSDNTNTDSLVNQADVVIADKMENNVTQVGVLSDNQILTDKENMKTIENSSLPTESDSQSIDFCITSNKCQTPPQKTENSLAVVKYEMPKLAFSFSNQSYSSINNDIIIDTSINYENISQNLITEKSNNKHNYQKKDNYDLHKHITLQSALHDVDELMLENVDTGQVSGILDTSSNSDDIMNVDQFVNERFKKLTEPDIDMQNNSLHLELPPLDIFQFHTS